MLTTGKGELFEGIRSGTGDQGIPIVAGDPECRDQPEAYLVPDNAIVVPLRARGRTLGTILLGHVNSRSRATADDLALAVDLAGRAAIAIDNARLYRDVQENDRRKNEFLAMLAHELRNPLAPIKSAVEILQMVRLKDETLEWANEVISRQLEHLVRLVDDLLDLSRITGGKIQLRREPIDVSAAVARAVETSRPLIDARKQHLSVNLPVEPLWVNADLVRLAQVLANLLNNAAKYTEEKGEISLEVAHVDDKAIFRVRDNGIGISPDKISSIFDLFTQVDNALDRTHGGLGIGLTLVRQLVEMHGGTVVAHSEGARRGSEFVIALPAIPPAVCEDTTNHEPALDAPMPTDRPVRLAAARGKSATR